MSIHDIGTNLADRCFTARSFVDLAPFVRDFQSNNERTAAATLVLCSAALRMAQILETADAAGIKINPPPPTRNDLEYLAAASTNDFFTAAASVFETVRTLWRQVPGMTLSNGRKDSAPPPPQKIDIKVTMPDQINVGAMPMRVTTTEIERDDNGNIVSSRQVEADAA